jgi:hypothetical protein
VRISSTLLDATRSGGATQGGEPGQFHLGTEPIRPAIHPRSDFHSLGHGQRIPSRNQTPRAAGAFTIDSLVLQIQREYPHSQIRVTGRGRTPRRQAELMAQRRRANPDQFLHTYLPAQHITEMDEWVTSHPKASEAETTNAFEQIIHRALQRGARVSNHLSDRARDISIPVGTPEQRRAIRHRFSEIGGHVIDEHDATGGPHWHVDLLGPG